MVRSFLPRNLLPYLNDPAQPLEKINRLMRSQPVLVQQFENIVDDRAHSLSKQVRLRESRFRDLGTGILAAELGDDRVRGLAACRGLSAKAEMLAVRK